MFRNLRVVVRQRCFVGGGGGARSEGGGNSRSLPETNMRCWSHASSLAEMMVEDNAAICLMGWGCQ